MIGASVQIVAPSPGMRLPLPGLGSIAPDEAPSPRNGERVGVRGELDREAKHYAASLTEGNPASAIASSASS